MTILKSMTAVAALAIAMPAFAQTQAQADPNAMPPPAPAYAGTSGQDTSSTGPMSADQMPPAQAGALAAGDNAVITNGPVPDTPANRAKFGGPMSNAGRKTHPAGN